MIGGNKDKPLLFDVKACLDVSFVKTIAKAIAAKVYPGTVKWNVKKSFKTDKKIGKGSG